MIFTESPLAGVYMIELERLADERGFFARSYCAEEFAARGLWPELRQCSVSYNARAGTLRGLHYQSAPHEEHKLVRCTAGAVFDVVVDIRESSPTYRRWFGAELTAANRLSLFIPPGFAHGFLSLSERRGGVLHDLGGIRPAIQPRLSLERPRVRDRVAIGAHGDFRARCVLS